MTGQRRRPPVSKCRACDESIVWCETAAGKRMPVDIEPVEGGNLQLTPRGPRPPLVVVVSDRRPGQKLHVSHFASCKKAKRRGRKGTESPQRKPQPAGQDALFGGGR